MSTPNQSVQVNTTMGARQWLLLVFLSILWGGSFFFIGVAVKSLPPFTIVAIRVTIAALAMLAVLRILGIRVPRSRELWISFAIMGLLNNAVPFCLIVWGQTQIAAGLASTLNATTPFFTLIIANMFTQDEKITAGKLVGLIIGFVGVVIIIGPSALHGLGGNMIAQLAVLGASLSYATAGVYARRFQRQGVSPLIVTNGQLISASVMLTPVALLVDKPFTLPPPPWQTWAAILSLALLSTSLAYIIYFRILASSGATNALLVTMLVPVNATILGALLLNEQLEPRQFLGFAFLAVGLAVIDGRLLKPLYRNRGKHDLHAVKH